MIIDAHNLLSDAQAVSADAASTNTFDSGSAGNDVSVGENPLVLVIQVDVAADFTTTDETYEFQIIQSAAANLGSPDILAQRTIAASALTAGSLHYLQLPPGSKTKRYLGAYYNVGGTSPSVTVTAFFQPSDMIQVNKVYPDNIVITG